MGMGRMLLVSAPLAYQAVGRALIEDSGLETKPEVCPQRRNQRIVNQCFEPE